jgi:hypothetical protein
MVLSPSTTSRQKAMSKGNNKVRTKKLTNRDPVVYDANSAVERNNRAAKVKLSAMAALMKRKEKELKESQGQCAYLAGEVAKHKVEIEKLQKTEGWAIGFFSRLRFW